ADRTFVELSRSSDDRRKPRERRIAALRAFFENPAEGKASRLFASTERIENTSSIESASISLVESNHFVAAMGQNYLAPAIIGLFDTAGSRSRAIRDAFTEHALRGKINLSQLGRFESEGTMPTSLF